MPNFSTPDRIQAVIRNGDEVEYVRDENRVKINNAANNFPPLDEDTARKLGVKINVNWGEMMILLSHARRQYLTAFLSNNHFFKVTLPLAPSEHQSEWGAFITDEINKPIRNSLDYFELHRSRWAGVVAHGIGPQVWYKKDRWLPDYVAIEDLRISTDTTLDFKNLSWFAVRQMYTPFELLDEAFNGKKDNGWNVEAIKQILSNYKEVNQDYSQSNYDWNSAPSKLAELVKQDGGYYSSTAMPAIPLWRFYFEDNDEKTGQKAWFLRIVPETGAVRGSAPQDKFLWTSETPVASKREHIMQCQFGDLSNKAPFMYHSIRSLGLSLMEPCFYTNLTRCRLLQHLHDNLNVWLRVTDPANKARAQVQEFANYGTLQTGVEIVPQAQRHQIDHELADSIMAQLKQLQQEASSTYTQQTDTGTKKERTAFETSVQTQQVNAMLSGLLLVAFKYATFEYREICRRFCLTKTADEDILKFQKRCRKAHIPQMWLDVDYWDVEPVTPLGMGNPTIAMASAQQLIQINGMLDPTAQQEVKHEYILAVTQDPRKAARWAPLGEGKGINDAQRDAQMAFGTLMQGVPLPIREGLSLIDQIESLIPLYAGKIDMINKRDMSGTPEEISGLSQVQKYLDTLIQRLAQNPQEEKKVKEYGDDMVELNNEFKALAQRGQEKAQQGNGNGGLTPEAQAKIHMITATAAAKVAAKDKADQQKLRHKETQFVKQERRKDAGAYAQIGRDAVKTTAEVNQNRLKSSFQE